MTRKERVDSETKSYPDTGYLIIHVADDVQGPAQNLGIDGLLGPAFPEEGGRQCEWCLGWHFHQPTLRGPSGWCELCRMRKLGIPLHFQVIK